MQNSIAIDLGSNTLRLLAYSCSQKKALFSYEKVVKTADGLVVHGAISHQAVSRVITALHEVQEQINFTRYRIRAVTTEAVRRASNAQEVLRRIAQETGVVFEVISGKEEANLTLLAVKKRLQILQHPSHSFVLVDIGGGSTELIFHYPDKTISQSFPVGIVTMAQSYLTLEKIEAALPKEMYAMQKFCRDCFAAKGAVSTFVATAGTPTTVAAMKLGQTYATYDAQRINGTSLMVDELDFYLKKLLSLPFDQREEAVGTGRSDLIAAGILIYRELYRLLGFASCVVVDDGLREGVALEGCLEE